MQDQSADNPKQIFEVNIGISPKARTALDLSVKALAWVQLYHKTKGIIKIYHLNL